MTTGELDVAVAIPHIDRMKCRGIGLVTMLCLLGVLPVLPVKGQDGIAALEKRVDALEQKVDRILELLEEKSVYDSREEIANAKSESSRGKVETADDGRLAATAGTSDKTQLQIGALLSAYRVDKTSYKTPQTSTPDERMSDKGNDFRVGNYLARESAKMFKNHLMGCKWQGYLWIEEPGDYMFTGQPGKRGGAMQLSINGQGLLAPKSRSTPALGEISIKDSGFYWLEIWIAPSRAYSSGSHNEVQAVFQYRRQGETKFTKITPGSLYSPKAKK